MSLSIGIIHGGVRASRTPMGRALCEIMNLIADEGEGSRIDRPPDLNVVFHTPGELLKPDYVGLRTSTFSTKEKAFMIQVAVPAKTMHSPEPERLIFSWMRDAIRLAKPRFARHKMAFSVEDHIAFVDEVEDIRQSPKYKRRFDRNKMDRSVDDSLALIRRLERTQRRNKR